ncbi:helix-turn-helix transcriptional regulator [Xylocopilactobacillus apis]|uniref:HTH cro/C1-type domain-containing protein n=1 Tax=Xylocopilactobacillus apis TaxID=2932183 RepID=A0AAU9D1D3_9LACO|nr:helix-turn-helix domain-containing protein [Xylocopilactobacillus apis]BDR57519.1 hypothetical protein KIMC2_20810 [Xylocopilactobacillus apis]
MNKISVGNLIAFHPGYYILEYLNHEGMTQEELAERLNTNKKKVSELVNGKINLDDELITNLSLALGTSETVWRNLNNKYKEVKAKIDAERNLESERPILEQMDYSYWVKLDCVKNTRDFKEKVEELKRHFRISTLKVLSKKIFWFSIGLLSKRLNPRILLILMLGYKRH